MTGLSGAVDAEAWFKCCDDGGGGKAPRGTKMLSQRQFSAVVVGHHGPGKKVQF